MSDDKMELLFEISKIILDSNYLLNNIENIKFIRSENKITIKLNNQVKNKVFNVRVLNSERLILLNNIIRKEYNSTRIFKLYKELLE